MAIQAQFDHLTRVNGAALKAMVFGSGARILFGPAAPVSDVTGKGSAGPGSIYIATGIGEPALYENTGTKLAPVWTLRHGGVQ